MRLMTKFISALAVLGAAGCSNYGAPALRITEPVEHASKPPIVLAQDEPGYPHRGAPLMTAWIACNDDIRRYCSDVMPGGGRIIQCLIYNLDRLRPACREGIARARDALRP